MRVRLLGACSLISMVALTGCGSSGDPAASTGPGGWSAPPPPRPHVATPSKPELSGEATSFYFSYDESASTASRDLSLFAIENGGYVNASWGRTYEFLNAEHFEHFASEKMGPFEVSINMLQYENDTIPVNQSYEGDFFALGVNVSSEELTHEQRKNVVLTFVVDISGSMDTRYADESRADIQTLLDVTKHALVQVTESLKEGDVINLVTFESTANIALTGWQYDPEDGSYQELVEGLRTRGSTNLNQGIEFGYQVALETYDPEKANRVIMMTDAYANTGEVRVERIAENTTINDLEGIRFAGIGIGSAFQEDFLNELTDAGKGAYSAMITPSDAERIMTDDFMRFIDNAVTNVKFRLEYPPALDQLQSSAEEVSESADEVQASHFAYNSSQFFLEFFSGSASGDDEITLTATYDGVDGVEESASIRKTVAELLDTAGDETRAAILVTRLAKLIAGELDCETVIHNDFFNATSEHVLFVNYQGLISDFCEQTSL